jgi:hypothetical protein
MPHPLHARNLSSWMTGFREQRLILESISDDLFGRPHAFTLETETTGPCTHRHKFAFMLRSQQARRASPLPPSEG